MEKKKVKKVKKNSNSNDKELKRKSNFKLLEAEESKKKLSHKLFQAFDFQSSALEDNYICLLCKGVAINPLFCADCGYSYCEDCISSIADKMIHCHCKTPTKGNFKAQDNHELNQTYYFIIDLSDSNMIKRISYSEALKAKNNIGYSFVKFFGLDDDLKKYTSYSNVESRLKIMNKNIKHKNKFNQKFVLQCAKIVNFMFRKGYRLNLEEKNLFQNMGHLLRILHLKGIYFFDCLITLEFALPFSKGIDLNRKRLHSFNLLACTDLYGGSLDEKSYRLILNALSFCSNLGDIGLENHCYFPGKYSISESYIFLSPWFLLKTISLYQFSFHDDMNFHYFKSLTSLKELCLESCLFQVNSFLLLYGNNIPKLNKLILIDNYIINFDLNLSNNLIPNLDNQMKFPPILEIMVQSHQLEYYIFLILIQSSTTILKSLSLNWNIDNISSEQYKSLKNFFELSKIQFLELNGIRIDAIVESHEFCDFLKNSEHLKIFKLDVKYFNQNNLVFKSMKSNHSIQILYLHGKMLSKFSADLENLIMFNSSISTLVIDDYTWKIDEGFIKTVIKSKSLKYVFLQVNHQKDEIVLKLLASNLKGIYISSNAISKEAMDEIHRKLPRIEYSENLQYYEKYLN